MTSATLPSRWDFSPVFDLIQSLSHRDAASGTHAKQPISTSTGAALAPHLRSADVGEQKLGDFDRIWDFLGVQRDVPPPKISTFEASTAGQAKDIDAYASDGTLYYPPSAKSVKWRDEEEGLHLTDVQPESPPDDGHLTKNQRKKRNRKARVAAGVPQEATTPDDTSVLKKDEVSASSSNLTVLESRPSPYSKSRRLGNEENSGFPSELQRLTQARNLVAEQVSAQTPHLTKEQAVLGSPKLSSAKLNGTLRPGQVTPTNQSTVQYKAPLRPPVFDTLGNPAINQTPAKPILGSIHQSLQKQWPVAHPYAACKQSLTPNPPRPQHQPSVSSTAVAPATRSTPTPYRKRYEILPLQYNNSLDRNWSLLLKLMQNFPEDRAHLLSPLQLSINRPTLNGIHVFVDASNIIIGFHDTLKRARGIPYFARVPHVNLNFHALALLLERRRPVTKRVLAGSTPEIPAFEEARQVGYETCILDKVWKAKELTERQRRFAARGAGNPNGYQSGSDSAGNRFLGLDSSPTLGNGDAVITQRPKWVEQAVDEILHLKILESVVDTPSVPFSEVLQSTNDPSSNSAPCPTMVLATGDAAEAEYSSGFMKMVQRALEKGWRVEVMAWSKSISAEYRRMTSSAALGGRFRLIELDEYAEELFSETI